MDWFAVAALVCDSLTEPLFVLNASGQIQLWNGAVERLLGWERYAVTGRSLMQIFTAPKSTPAPTRCIEDALRGVLRRWECEATARGGVQYRVTLEFSTLGEGGSRCLVGIIKKSEPASTGLQPIGDPVYDISRRAADFGAIKWLSTGRPEDDAQVVGRRCYQELHGRSVPCRTCPVLDDPDKPWPRTVVFRPRPNDESFTAVIAELRDTDTVRVTMRSITEPMLRGLLEAKVSALVDRAALSEREREVLSLLLLGRTLNDVATALHLSVRTVKFHQANVLGKLGADSRFDLFRLIL